MSGWEKIAQQWARVRMAHQAVMLDDAQKLLTQQREQTKQHHERMSGIGGTVEDDSGVHIGDVIHQAPAQPVVQPTVRPGLLSWLPTALSVASLLGTGGLGAVLLTALSRLPAPQPAPVAPVAPVPQAEQKAAPVAPRDFKIKVWFEPDGKGKIGNLEEVKP